MTGPKKIGVWSDLKAVNIVKQREFLCNGHKYRVIKDFIDYDGTTHNAKLKNLDVKSLKSVLNW
jgi:hypothetical protein